MTRPKSALSLAVVTLLLALGIVWVRTPAVAPLGSTSSGYSYLDNLAAQQRLWHFPCVSALIESAFSYESNLIGYRIPVADQDLETCGVPGYTVRLPGHSWDHYGYAGTAFVAGSGWVLELTTPNGGRLSLLHLERVDFGTAAAPALAYAGQVPPGVDDATGLAVGGVALLPPRPTAIVLHGGEAVGLVGYPTDPIYGNGEVGPVNSQLCQLTDALGQNWLLRLAEGHDLPKPASFPLKRWQAHTTRISAYDGHHHLLHAASYWWHHAEWLGGVTGKRYVGRSTRNRNAYYLWRFQRGTITTWPAHPAWTPRVRKA